MSAPLALPRWADLVLVPLLSVVVAFVVAALVMLAIGVDPGSATMSILRGSLGTPEGIGFTLYYTTDFIFTGLAVAIAFQAGLFNIGAEGQAYVAGLGAALVCLHGGALPAVLLVPLGILGARRRRRAVGLCAGGAAGKAGQPHRHHDDHVQLAGHHADGLPAGQHAARALLHAARHGAVSAERAGALDAECPGPLRRHAARDAAEPLLCAGAALRGGRLGVWSGEPGSATPSARWAPIPSRPSMAASRRLALSC